MTRPADLVAHLNALAAAAKDSERNWGYLPTDAEMRFANALVASWSEIAAILERADEAEAEPFRCPAVMRHGPGHQSDTKCVRKTPHPIEGEHWAPDPMCPGFEWEGPESYDRY